MKIALDVKINQAYHLNERFELELLGDARENRGDCLLLRPGEHITAKRNHQVKVSYTYSVGSLADGERETVSPRYGDHNRKEN